MTNNLPAVTGGNTAVATREFNQEQLDLIKSTVAKGTTNDELALFLYVSKTTGLDPLTKQIYAIKRWSAKDRKEVMTIQVGIDGLRSIADRTGEYAPGKEVSYEYNPDGTLKKATAYLMKHVKGQWFEVSASAYWDEYKQEFQDKATGKWALSKFWKEKGHLMLGKCAEALVIRKAFPGQTANLYTAEEMPAVEKMQVQAQPQESVEAEVVRTEPKPEPKLAQLKMSALAMLDYSEIKSFTAKEKDGVLVGKIEVADMTMFSETTEQTKAIEEAFNLGKRVKINYAKTGKFIKIVDFKAEEKK